MPSAPDIYADSVVFDGLNVSNWGSPEVYRSLDAGRVTGINATVAIWEGFAQTMDNLAAWVHRFEARADTLAPATTAADILDAKETGKTGVVLGWQNSSPIENDLNRLALFHALGVRIVQITYNERNLVGNGCYERTDDGLSLFGQDLVREMNRLGMLIDLSHVGDRTTLEAAEMSAQPVACTHANARGFFDHPRNKTDDALRLIAENGGVIGANAFPPFLRNGFASTLSDYADAIEDLDRARGDRPRGHRDGLHAGAAQGVFRLDILAAGNETCRTSRTPTPKTCSTRRGWRRRTAWAAWQASSRGGDTPTGTSPRFWAATGCGCSSGFGADRERRKLRRGNFQREEREVSNESRPQPAPTLAGHALSRIS